MASTKSCRPCESRNYIDTSRATVFDAMEEGRSIQGAGAHTLSGKTRAQAPVRVTEKEKPQAPIAVWEECWLVVRAHPQEASPYRQEFCHGSAPPRPLKMVALEVPR
jgi:hypothetical protein